MNKALRIGIALVGLIATPIYWRFVLLQVLGWMMGDCFPSGQHSCPSDAQRNLAVVALFVGGTAIYGLGVALWKRLDARLSLGAAARR